MQEPGDTSAGAKHWKAVDTYFAGLLAPNDCVLTGVLAANAEARLPEHGVSALQGQMLALLVQVAGARRVLEIGTLGGYSTIHMARSLPPDGLVVTIEADAHHAAVARSNFERAGLAAHVHLHVGEYGPQRPGHTELR